MSFDQFKELFVIGFPALTALGGVYIGNNLELKRLKKLKKLEFIERQLDELYSPIMARLEEIQARYKTIAKLDIVGDAAWRELVANSPRPMRDHDEKFESYKKITEYNNQVLREEILPLFKEVGKIFLTKFRLASEKTKQYYGVLSEYIDLWERHLSGTLPTEVLERLDMSSQKLKPFYIEIKDQMQRLSDRLM